MWDFETRVVARTFQAHTQAVTCLAWARSGRYLMSGSLDRTVSLWDILDNRQVRHPCGQTSESVRSLCCLLSPAMVFTESDRNLVLGTDWRLHRGQAAKMQCAGPAVALSVDRKDPFTALFSYTQGAPELMNFHTGTSKPLPTIPLGGRTILV